MKISMKLGVRPGTGTSIGKDIANSAATAGKGVGVGASAVAKVATKAGAYVADRFDIDFDLEKAIKGGEEGFKKAKDGSNLSKVASAVRGAVNAGGLNLTSREAPRSSGTKGARHAGRSHEPSTRSTRSAERGSSK